MTLNLVAKRRADAFDALSRKLGGASAFLLDPKVLAKADAAVANLIPQVLDEIEQAALTMKQLAESEETPSTIFALAHDIRGLADMCQRPTASVFAGALRAYGADAGEGFAPDWNLLRNLTGALYHAVNGSDDIPLAAAEGLCVAAVTKTMRLEGRTTPDRPW